MTSVSKITPALMTALLALTGAAQADNAFSVRGSLQLQNPERTKLYDNNLNSGFWFGYGGYYGPNYPDEGVKVNPSATGAVELGVDYRFSPAFRGEIAYSESGKSKLEFAYGPGTADFTVKSRQAMLNGYVDLAPLVFSRDTVGAYTPYVMAGIGSTQNINSDYRCSSLANCTKVVYANANTHTDFAWQVGIGMQVPVSDKLMIDAGIRHLDLGKTQGKDVPNDSIGLHANWVVDTVSIGLSMPLGGR